MSKIRHFDTKAFFSIKINANLSDNMKKTVKKSIIFSHHYLRIKKNTIFAPV
jgi:hypothetical protein